jgi:hypothetical protein
VPEFRCRHGFLRSQVKCPACDASDLERERRENQLRKYELARDPSAPRRPKAEATNLNGTYTCKTCGQTKPLSEFYVSRTEKRGHQSRCKACDNNKRTQANIRQRGHV